VDRVEENSVRDNQRLVLVVSIFLTSFFNSFMGAAVNIAIPEISREYDLGAAELSWVAMSYLLASSVFLLPVGKLADLRGRKKVFLLGNILFMLGSLMAVFSPNGTVLIVLRFVQGIGGAMIMSTGMAIITSVYPPAKRGKMLGLAVSAVYLGLTLAPVLGGILTQTAGWRSLFIINASAGFLVTIAVFFLVKGEWAQQEKQKYDFSGALLYMVSIFLLLYGFSYLPLTYAAIMTAAGLAGLVFFVWYEWKRRHPLLDISLFGQNRRFAMSNLAALINYSATFAITFMISLYLQYTRGMGPKDAGMILISQPVMMVLTAYIAGRLSDRFNPGTLASIGMGIIVAGLSMMVFIHEATSIQYIIGCLVVVGLGFGFFSSPNTNAIMGSVDKRFLGIASATSGTMRLIGQNMSMALAAMILHTYIGEDKIGKENMPLFMEALRIIFFICIALCVMGVFASLARGKSTQSGAK
jgi:EmrB/QacA subfamily drug resistance transporter